MQHQSRSEDERSPRRGLPPVAKFVCGAALILSVGLTVPFVLARRKSALPNGPVHLGPSSFSRTLGNARLLSGGSSPAALLARSTNTSGLGTSLSADPRKLLPSTYSSLFAASNGSGESDAKEANSSPPDTLGAISHAIQAFGIATGMVLIGAGTAFASVRWIIDIEDLDQFHTTMRTVIRDHFPVMHSRLHMPELPDSPPSPETAIVEEPYSWPAAEQALETALAEGGWKAWGAEARRQLEKELDASRTAGDAHHRSTNA